MLRLTILFLNVMLCQAVAFVTLILRQDSTNDRGVASYPANSGLNTDDSSFMLQRALANDE